MTPPYSANSSSSPFPFELSNEDHHHHHHQNHNLNFTTPNYHNVSSSSSAHSQPSHLFLNSRSSWDQPQLYYDSSDPQFFYPQHPKVDNHAANGGSYDQGPKTKASLWRSTNNCEDNNDHHTHDEGIIPVKWMSSKMRVMQKMKSSGSNRACQGATMASAATTITTTVAAAITTATATTTETMKIIEDQKRASSCLESENSSNSSSNHSSSNVVVPIRVCADCNTTKTPLWRSGPKGPKSLCNACGIRQRKARRAMAAAAAKAAAVATTEAAESSLKINKAKPTKEKPTTTAAAKNPTGVNHHDVTPFKKRYKIVAGERPSDHEAKKTKKKNNKMNGFEDFLIKLSKNSAYHRVFPQDEKDAAILLMALSCGLVHS